jgi:hypothetical protein
MLRRDIFSRGIVAVIRCDLIRITVRRLEPDTESPANIR